MTDEQIIAAFAGIVHRVLDGPSTCRAPALRELYGKLEQAVLERPQTPKLEQSETEHG